MDSKYPQALWAKEIAGILKQLSADNAETEIWDAPAGNGMVGALVAQRLNYSQLTLLDYNKNILHSPFLNRQERTHCIVGDIFTHAPSGDKHIWLLINSLYCLPDKDRLIEGKRRYFRYIVAVLPDISAANYRYFRKHNPLFENPSSMNLTETENFFIKHGYKPLLKKKVTRIPFHKWNTCLDKLHVYPQIRNKIYAWLDKILFFLPAQYAIIAFERNEKPNH